MTADPPLAVVRTVADLRDRRAAFRADGCRIALVPTMGALHAGHLDLIRRAKAAADVCIVSIFVNPTQFGPNEDFSVYPRREADDLAAAAAAGADLAFVPGVDEMYPPGQIVRVTVPGLGDRLEGEHRPGFFTGVATVVTKLLLQALPDAAVFGEKDFQQLLVIRRLVADLDIPVEIVGAPTVREADGLALSSRNAYLSPEDRTAAPALFAALSTVADGMARGGPADALAAEARSRLIAAGFAEPDYVAVCDACTLDPVAHRGDLNGGEGRVLGAARLGTTRLIDNAAFR
jgi:pantoate--beta-alanine ligase